MLRRTAAGLQRIGAVGIHGLQDDAQQAVAAEVGFEQLARAVQAARAHVDAALHLQGGAVGLEQGRQVGEGRLQRGNDVGKIVVEAVVRGGGQL